MPNQSDPINPQTADSSQTTAVLSVDNTPPVIPDFQSTDIPPLPAEDTVPVSSIQPPVSSDDTSSAAPPDTPPMITSTPKKKFGGGKIIATILGLFLLIGGIGAGIFLTRQNQNIKEKASEGYRLEKKCKLLDGSTKWCLIDTVGCDNDSGGPILCSNAPWYNQNGTICEDVTEPCSGGGGGGGGAQCVDAIKVFNTDWNQLDAGQLANLKTGDVIRLAIRDSYTTPQRTYNFSAARFTVNGTRRPKVTAKNPAGNMFYDQYTIPSGVTSFNIEAEVKWGSIWIGK